ncbi:MAG: hypothetical protein KJZ69_18350 [Phycisphaerales bacterium]|nr:hypothetical protein [Phycisphaerales bacterium]
MQRQTAQPRHRTRVGVLLLLGLTALPAEAAAQRYEIFGIGTFYRESRARGVNNRGVVVGWSPPPGGGPDQAVVWERGELSILGPGDAQAVNDAGDVVGRNHEFLAVMWRQGEPIVIGTLEGHDNSAALAINTLGQVACNATSRAGRRSAFLWQDGVSVPLGTLGGATCEVTDINSVSQIVGKSALPSGFEHAFIWLDGDMTDLPPLEGHDQSFANGVSDHGVVVGASIAGSDLTPCMWIDGRPEALPRLGGDRWTRPQTINKQGIIVGAASSITLHERAVIWRDGVIADLNDYVFGTGWTLESAMDINEQGWIVGVGVFDGFKQGYVMIPLPTLEADPLIAGRRAEFRMRDGLADAPAYLAYSTTGYGSTRVPGLSVVLDLHRPALAASGRTDATGRAQWSLNIPPGSQGRRVYFQAAQFRRTSNVVVSTIE